MLRSAAKKKENGFGLTFKNPARIEAQFDPIMQLGILFNLEEVMRRKNPSLRVLRCNRSGVSIYVRAPAPYQVGLDFHRYVVAYEGEVSAACHVKQILAQSDDPTCVWRVLNLVEQHARLLQEKFQARARASRPSLAELERLGGFHLSRMRKSIQTSLAALSEVEPARDCYPGFINAVLSLASENLSSPLKSGVPGRI